MRTKAACAYIIHTYISFHYHGPCFVTCVKIYHIICSTWLGNGDTGIALILAEHNKLKTPARTKIRRERGPETLDSSLVGGCGGYPR